MSEKEEKILNTIKEFAKKLPRFPDSRIDYSNSDTAPVIRIFLKYKDEFLLLKRSEKVRTYQGKWNAVAGYLDEVKPIRKKVLEEIKEELGVTEDDILSIRIGETFEFTDNIIKKTWIVHPILAKLKNKPDIKLDWEHTEHKWIKLEELGSFDTVPHLSRGLEGN